MKTFKIKDKDYQVVDCWEDLTLNQYVKLVKLRSREKEFGVELMYMQKQFEILCNCDNGELGKMKVNQLEGFLGHLNFFKQIPEWDKKDHITIDGVDYVFKQDMNELDLDEIITIQLIQKRYTDPSDWIVGTLAVILRPGKKEVDPEAKKEIWIQQEFDNKNLEFRTTLFTEKCKAADVLGYSDFFFGGNAKLTKTSVAVPDQKQGTVA